MENTKDLVRAERGGRFVCQAKGGGDACRPPTPGAPRSSLTPLPGLFPASHAPSASAAPLPLPAVKRFGGLPSPRPPPQPRLGRGSLALRAPYPPLEGNVEEKVFSAPRPLPLQLWLVQEGGGEARWVTCTFFEPPRVGRGVLPFPPGRGGRRVGGPSSGRSPRPPRGRGREGFARGGGGGRGRGGHVWEAAVGVVMGKPPPLPLV